MDEYELVVFKSRGGLCGFALAQHPYPQINIMATGQHRKKYRQNNEGVAIDFYIRPGEDLDKEDEEGRGYLASCCDFTEDARDRFDRKGTPVEKKKTDGYNKVLQNDKRREPHRNNTFDAQHNKGPHKHRLVGDGIKVRPQVCFFAHDTGDKSVEHVRYPLEDEKV